MDDVLARLDGLPRGYSKGLYDGRRYGVTLSISADGRRRWLYAEELGGAGRVSCNVYLAGGRLLLKPCEMSEEKVTDFILHFRPAEPA